MFDMRMEADLDQRASFCLFRDGDSAIILLFITGRPWGNLIPAQHPKGPHLTVRYFSPIPS